MNDLLPWIDFAAAATVSVACTLAGWHAAGRRTARRETLAALGFALLAWPVLTGIVPDRLYFAYPSFALGQALFGTAFFLSGVLARRYADTPLRRILQGVLGVVTVYFVLADPLWFALNARSLRALEGRISEGVTLQSEFYTCMPSALATVLRRWGIEASEGEVAHHMRTTFQGTSPNRVPVAARALGGRLGLDARVLDATLDELARIDRPALLIGKAGSVRHAIALIALDERSVVIGDPLRGLIRVRRAELSRQFEWNGLAIVITAPAAGAAPRLRP